MIQAKLIIGGNQTERLNLAQEMIKKHLGRLNHPDLLTVEGDPSITINQVRELKKRLARKPYSASVKIAFFPEAEKITFPAQNALLKTLEEPPGETLIILLTAKKEALLPTIISRCQIIHLPEKSQIKIDQPVISYQLLAISKVLHSRVGERLTIAEEYSPNRQEAIDFCQKQLVVWREILRHQVRPLGRSDLSGGPTSSQHLTPKQIARILRHLHQALIFLEANLNPQLVIEDLLLNYPTSASQLVLTKEKRQFKINSE